jgi:hypothetical protein
VLATTILASSLAFIDGSVVNVGLSAIGEHLPRCSLSAHWWAGLIRACWPDSVSRRLGWPAFFYAG